MPEYDGFVYEEKQYTLRSFINNYCLNLPCIIIIRDGHLGDENHTFANYDIYRITKVHIQARVVCRNYSGKLISFPKNYRGHQFQILAQYGRHEKASAPLYLKDVFKHWTSTQPRPNMDMRFQVLDNSEVSYSKQGVMEHQAELGKLSFEEAYDEVYLETFTVLPDKVAAEPILLPAYIEMNVSLVTGFVEKDHERFTKLLYCGNPDVGEQVKHADVFRVNLELAQLPSSQVAYSDVPSDNAVYIYKTAQLLRDEVHIDAEECVIYDDSNTLFLRVRTNQSENRQTPTLTTKTNDSSSAIKTTPSRLQGGFDRSVRRPVPLPDEKISSLVTPVANSNAKELTKKLQSVELPQVLGTGESASDQAVHTTTNQGIVLHLNTGKEPPGLPQGVGTGCQLSSVGNTLPTQAKGKACPSVASSGYQTITQDSDSDEDDYEDVSDLADYRLHFLTEKMENPNEEESSYDYASSIPMKRHFDKMNEIPKDLSGLTTEAVLECLYLLNMSEYKLSFLKHQVDGDMMKTLDKQMLVEDFKFSRMNAHKMILFINGWRQHTDDQDV